MNDRIAQIFWARISTVLSKALGKSERLEPAPDTKQIADQLRSILAELDALPHCEIAALRIDEAINALSDFADGQN